jgi:hypothetical protein
MFNELAVIALLLKVLFEAGIIFCIVRYDDDYAKYKPLIGILASLFAGTMAVAILFQVRDFFVSPLSVKLDWPGTATTFFLLMAVLNVKGNVAMFANPIISFCSHARKHFNV